MIDDDIIMMDDTNDNISSWNNLDDISFIKDVYNSILSKLDYIDNLKSNFKKLTDSLVNLGFKEKKICELTSGELIVYDQLWEDEKNELKEKEYFFDYRILDLKTINPDSDGFIILSSIVIKLDSDNYVSYNFLYSLNKHAWFLHSALLDNKLGRHGNNLYGCKHIYFNKEVLFNVLADENLSLKLTEKTIELINEKDKLNYWHKCMTRSLFKQKHPVLNIETLVI